MIEIFYHNDNKYVNSVDLHRVLEFSSPHYSRNFNRWINSEYLFQGKKTLTKPVENYDFILIPKPSSVKQIGNIGDAHLIRLEFAKLITIDSDSKFKKQFVQWLLKLDEAVENNQLLSQETVLGLLEMANACTYMDDQLHYYKEHKRFFLDCIEDPAKYHEFDNWRNRILEIDRSSDIGQQYRLSSHVGNLSSKIEKLAFLDDLASIRNTMFDRLKMMYNKVDPLYPGSTEKAMDLANFIRSMHTKMGFKPVMKRRNYEQGYQMQIFAEPGIDYVLIQNTIRALLK